MVSHPVEDISDNNMSTCPGPGTTGKMGSEDTQKDDRPKCLNFFRTYPFLKPCILLHSSGLAI